jgi:DNA-binding MarR family transcriptional regulator
MAELQNTLQHAANLENEISTMHAKQKVVRKAHESLEHLHKKQASLHMKRAKVLIFLLRRNFHLILSIRNISERRSLSQISVMKASLKSV